MESSVGLNILTTFVKRFNYALYGLTKSSKELDSRNKKLLYSGLIHSHLTYGLPMWGFAKKGRLNILLMKQKKAIHKVYNLKYRHHTHNYFIEGKILKLPDLIKHSTICYMQKGLNRFGHPHVSQSCQRTEREQSSLDFYLRFLVPESTLSPRLKAVTCLSLLLC